MEKVSIGGEGGKRAGGEGNGEEGEGSIQQEKNDCRCWGKWGRKSNSSGRLSSKRTLKRLSLGGRGGRKQDAH